MIDPKQIKKGVSVNDILSSLVSSEVSITAATTLTSTAFGKMHVCSGTTADYTVGLPAVSGNAGKIIGFRMASSLTKLITLDGNGTETIDGELIRTMWARETAILMCDGTEWIKIAGKSIPFNIRLQLQDNNDALDRAQQISSDAMTKVLHNEFLASVPSLYNTSNSTVIISREGTYNIIANTQWDASSPWSASRVLNRVFVNNAEALFGEMAMTSGTYLGAALPGVLILQPGDVLYHAVYQTSGSNQYLYGNRSCYLQIIEVPIW